MLVILDRATRKTWTTSLKHIKTNSTWIKDLNVGPETKFPEENIGSKLFDSGLGNIFLIFLLSQAQQRLKQTHGTYIKLKCSVQRRKPLTIQKNNLLNGKCSTQHIQYRVNIQNIQSTHTTHHQKGNPIKKMDKEPE